MAQKNEIPLLYIFLYSKFKERCFRDNFLDTATVLSILKQNVFHVPNNFHHFILRELADYGLIRKIYRIKYEILDSTISIDRKLKQHQDEIREIIDKINSGGKIRCNDESFYKLIPHSCVKKLKNLNCWILS